MVSSFRRHSAPGTTSCSAAFLTVDEIGIGLGIIVGALVLWWLAGLLNAEEERSAGSLYFMPLRGWAVVTAVIGLILTVANVIHAIRL